MAESLIDGAKTVLARRLDVQDTKFNARWSEHLHARVFDLGIEVIQFTLQPLSRLCLLGRWLGVGSQPART
jgi:hypothetical protein